MAVKTDRMDIEKVAGKIVDCEKPVPESLVMRLVLSVLLDIRDQNEELLNFVRED